MVYINQAEIDTFIADAKSKIAEIGLIVAAATISGQPFWTEMHFTYELGALLTSLEDPYLDWDESDIFNYIHYYNDQL